MSGYLDGRNKGASDAEAGKDRSFRPANALQGLKMLASETYRKNHAEGVRAGFSDAKQAQQHEKKS